jgi:hypothetical protein
MITLNALNRSRFSFFHIFCQSSMQRGAPTPRAEWIVLPLMWVAAMPVAAVTATVELKSSPYSARSSDMMAFNRKLKGACSSTRVRTYRLQAWDFLSTLQLQCARTSCQCQHRLQPVGCNPDQLGYS